MPTYAGESIKTAGVSADGKTLTLLGSTKFYVFPFEGVLPATKADLRAEVQAGVTAALDTVLRADPPTPAAEPASSPPPPEPIEAHDRFL